MFHGDRVVFVFFVDFPPGFRGYFRSTSFGGSAVCVCVCVTSADFGTDFGTSTRAPAMDNEVVVSHNLGLSIRVSPMMRCIFFFYGQQQRRRQRKKKGRTSTATGGGRKLMKNNKKRNMEAMMNVRRMQMLFLFFRSI